MENQNPETSKSTTASLLPVWVRIFLALFLSVFSFFAGTGISTLCRNYSVNITMPSRGICADPGLNGFGLLFIWPATFIFQLILSYKIIGENYKKASTILWVIAITIIEILIYAFPAAYLGVA